jgi:hypothetical protein
MKKPYEIFYAVATGPDRRRRLLTAVGLLIFTGLLLLLVLGSLFTDRTVGLPRLLPGAPGSLIGVFLFDSPSAIAFDYQAHRCGAWR